MLADRAGPLCPGGVQPDAACPHAEGEGVLRMRSATMVSPDGLRSHRWSLLVITRWRSSDPDTAPSPLIEATPSLLRDVH